MKIEIEVEDVEAVIEDLDSAKNYFWIQDRAWGSINDLKDKLQRAVDNA